MKLKSKEYGITSNFEFRPNICIEREEIDESKKSNATSTPAQQQSNNSGVVITSEGKAPAELITEDPGDDSDEVFESRQSRQFSAHVRMSSCNDEGLSYICETKYVTFLMACFVFFTVHIFKGNC